ncbi:hypothetical protein PF66_06411 [Pseudomonas asplenii]|uniref:Uncharacterized protein n=1 Tax=Pseudomonas asplenii TaxID=53407 RepID=A0A0M9GBQ2_9PSED|nr:hypothetical protein [Pseudomonas fuscovaginae]KPA87066.1 hypothetical protein PF66_06411 [Pseudomonas fuscovaginae]
MTDIYDRAKASAARVLAPRSRGGKGLELSLIRVTTGEYDPGIGGSTVTTEQFDGSGLRQNYRLQDIDGALIKQGDVKILISPVLLNGVDMPQPVTLDKITFDGETYTVQHVDPWDYAGVAVGFSVQARK